MDKLVYHKEIFNIVSSCKTPLIESSFIQVDYTDDIKAKTQELDIKVEKIQDKLRLFANTINVKVIWSIDSFLNENDISMGSNLMIIDGKRSISFIDGKTYFNFEQVDSYLVTNFIAFKEFIRLLKDSERGNDDGFHFVDSFNRDTRRIVLVSLSDKGRATITYELKAPLFEQTKDLRLGFDKFKSCFDDQNKSLLKFLKSAIIATATRFPCENRMKLLFESLDDVVNKAMMNFEVYLNNLSIDKIKKDYNEVKSKYFENLSDILSKLSQKIIALPIGISATLFTIEKIQDIPFFLYFLIAALIITSAYISFLLSLHFNDLLYVSKIFKHDYASLIENNFFIKYPDEKSLFEEINSRILDRISFLRVLIETYYWVMNLANLIIIYYILSKLDVNRFVIIGSIIALVSILFLFRFNLLSEKNRFDRD